MLLTTAGRKAQVLKNVIAHFIEGDDSSGEDGVQREIRSCVFFLSVGGDGDAMDQ